MQYPSQLLTVNLPNAQGKLTKYYTYDGYLEENVRQSIRDKAHALEHLKWTGTSLFAYIGFIVNLVSLRSVEDCPFPHCQSAAIRFPWEDSCSQPLPASSDIGCSISISQPNWHPLPRKKSLPPTVYPSGLIWDAESTLTELSSSWPTKDTTNLLSSTLVCTNDGM